MLWEGKQLRDVNEADVRQVIESGLEEHLQLEYKSELYSENDRGRKEFLLDVCMFANTEGGILLIGVPERRDESGQPTGVPDVAADLGIELSNPGAVLLGYDARVTESVEERLPLESAAIDVGNGRLVLAIRIPNSSKKPHSVVRDGHIYFVARRERHRYHMDVREIKETVMRTAGRLQQAEDALARLFLAAPHGPDHPHLAMGIVPVFFDDFLIDLRNERVVDALARFDRLGRAGRHQAPAYSFVGLEHHGESLDYRATLRRNGLLDASLQVRLTPVPGEANDIVDPRTIESHLQAFVAQAKTVYERVEIAAPFVLGMMLKASQPFKGAFPSIGIPSGIDLTAALPPQDYRFPLILVDHLGDVNRVIRPLCDQAHQMFGRAASTSFNADGDWIGIRA
jgi:hypothetical protein